VFHATGESKAVARTNAAQKAVDALRPKIDAELERRKVEKAARIEAEQADREDRFKRALKQKEEGEVGSYSKNDAKNQASFTTDEGTGDAQDGTVAGEDAGEAKARIFGVGSSKLLKYIRPEVSYAAKVIPDAPDGHKYEAKVEVDGTLFEGHSDFLALAKALAAASALTSLFNMSFEYSPRKNFTFMLICFLGK